MGGTVAPVRGTRRNAQRPTGLHPFNARGTLVKPTIWYRLAAVLLLLFAAGHQFGFRQVDPRWNAAAVVEAMRTTRFPVQGFDRSYWDFFSGFGFFVTVVLVYSAAFAWQVAGLASDSRRALQPVLWLFALSYCVIGALTWTHFFAAPGIFATLVAASLVVGAIGTIAEHRGASVRRATITAG